MGAASPRRRRRRRRCAVELATAEERRAEQVYARRRPDDPAVVQGICALARWSHRHVQPGWRWGGSRWHQAVVRIAPLVAHAVDARRLVESSTNWSASRSPRRARASSVDSPWAVAQADVDHGVSGRPNAVRSASRAGCCEDSENCASPLCDPGEAADQADSNAGVRALRIERCPLAVCRRSAARETAQPDDVVDLVVAFASIMPVSSIRRWMSRPRYARGARTWPPTAHRDGPARSMDLVGQLDAVADAPTISTPPSASWRGFR